MRNIGKRLVEGEERARKRGEGKTTTTTTTTTTRICFVVKGHVLIEDSPLDFPGLICVQSRARRPRSPFRLPFASGLFLLHLWFDFSSLSVHYRFAIGWPPVRCRLASGWPPVGLRFAYGSPLVRYRFASGSLKSGSPLARQWFAIDSPSVCL